MQSPYIPREKNPLPAPLLQISHFSLLSYQPYRQGIWHQHSLPEILFIKSGLGYLHIGNRIVSILPGTVCVIPAFSLHYINAEENCQLTYYSIGIHSAVLPSSRQPGGIESPWLLLPSEGVSSPEEYAGSSSSRRAASESTAVPPFPAAPFFNSSSCLVAENMDPRGFISAGFALLEQLFYSDSHDTADTQLFQLTANDLLWWIRYEADHRRVLPFHPGKIAIHDIITYISSHYSEEMHLPEMAHQFGISPSHMNRLFNKYCGLSPKNYVSYFRLNIALRLLTHSDLSIAEITKEVGWQNQGHFNRLFREIIGCLPAEYRAQNRSGVH